MTPVFLVPELGGATPGEALELPPDEAAHAGRVLRLVSGAGVLLVDGRGLRAGATVTEVSRGRVAVGVGWIERPTPPSPAVRMVVAPPKGARAEGMVDQLAQLGVDAWVPLETHRGNPDGSPNRRRRWERAAAEAAKQCGRAALLRVEAAVTLDAALTAPAGGLRVLADPGGAAPSLPAGTAGVEVLVGPEGGFTEEERDAALAAGAVAWRLGPHVLRIETAAVAAAAAVRALHGSAPH